ncbi:hypothetical protein GCS57_003528 [Vibrio cholerae]
MFGFGKKDKIDKLVNAIGSVITGQTILMTISADQLIRDVQKEPLIAGYFLGFQLHLIQNSPFPEKDHQGILSDSYYNLFGPDGDKAKLFAFQMAGARNAEFNAGIEFAINDLTEWQSNPSNSPIGLLRLIDRLYPSS